LRLVFLGTPPVAVPTLDALIGAGHRVPLVVSQPDRPVGRSSSLRPPAVKVAAAAHGIEVFQPRKVRNTAFRERLAAARPDVLVVVAYGRILTRPVLDLGRLGAVNVHFSLLPAYRGAAPVQWTLARGESVTGVTTMSMNEGMDEGDILLQRELPIESGEHAPALAGRMASCGAELLLETLDRLDSGILAPRVQDHEQASYAPRLTPADGSYDPRLTAQEIEGRVRGFDPWPGVWAGIGERRLRLLEARALDGGSEEAAAGQVIELSSEGLVVACAANTALLLTRLQPAGRRALAARDAVNGRHVRPGDRLVRPDASR